MGDGDSTAPLGSGCRGGGAGYNAALKLLTELSVESQQYKCFKFEPFISG